MRPPPVQRWFRKRLSRVATTALADEQATLLPEAPAKPPARLMSGAPATLLPRAPATREAKKHPSNSVEGVQSCKGFAPAGSVAVWGSRSRPCLHEEIQIRALRGFKIIGYAANLNTIDQFFFFDTHYIH